jgi:cyclic pyranopterin phosphate synthase
MPEEGINYVDRKDLMTYEEMERIVKLLHSKGVNKLRITGGEPFLRKGLMDFISNVSKLEGLKIHITSNGTLLRQHLRELKQLGVTSINLSIDSLDRERFKDITRRDELDNVMSCFHEMIDLGFDVKINTVVMKSSNLDDIIPVSTLARDYPVDVRFLEEMPFNGGSDTNECFNHIDIYNLLNDAYPKITKLPFKESATATNYTIPGFKGNLGIIASYSRTFCGTCNRLRLTPLGTLKTCLYDNGVFNIKDLMRNGADDVAITDTLSDALNHRAKDGIEAEQKRFGNLGITESMAEIGG